MAQSCGRLTGRQLASLNHVLAGPLPVPALARFWAAPHSLPRWNFQPKSISSRSRGAESEPEAANVIRIERRRHPALYLKKAVSFCSFLVLLNSARFVQNCRKGSVHDDDVPARRNFNEPSHRSRRYETAEIVTLPDRSANSHWRLQEMIAMHLEKPNVKPVPVRVVPGGGTVQASFGIGQTAFKIELMKYCFNTSARSCISKVRENGPRTRSKRSIFQHSQTAIDFAREHRIDGVQIAVTFVDRQLMKWWRFPPIHPPSVRPPG